MLELLELLDRAITEVDMMHKGWSSGDVSEDQTQVLDQVGRVLDQLIGARDALELIKDKYPLEEVGALLESYAVKLEALEGRQC